MSTHQPSQEDQFFATLTPEQQQQYVNLKRNQNVENGFVQNQNQSPPQGSTFVQSTPVPMFMMQQPTQHFIQQPTQTFTLHHNQPVQLSNGVQNQLQFTNTPMPQPGVHTAYHQISPTGAATTTMYQSQSPRVQVYTYNPPNVPNGTNTGQNQPQHMNQPGQLVNVLQQQPGGGPQVRIHIVNPDILNNGTVTPTLQMPTSSVPINNGIGVNNNNNNNNNNGGAHMGGLHNNFLGHNVSHYQVNTPASPHNSNMHIPGQYHNQFPPTYNQTIPTHKKQSLKYFLANKKAQQWAKNYVNNKNIGHNYQSHFYYPNTTDGKNPPNHIVVNPHQSALSLLFPIFDINGNPLSNDPSASLTNAQQVESEYQKQQDDLHKLRLQQQQQLLNNPLLTIFGINDDFDGDIHHRRHHNHGNIAYDPFAVLLGMHGLNHHIDMNDQNNQIHHPIETLVGEPMSIDDELSRDPFFNHRIDRFGGNMHRDPFFSDPFFGGRSVGFGGPFGHDPFGEMLMGPQGRHNMLEHHPTQQNNQNTQQEQTIIPQRRHPGGLFGGLFNDDRIFGNMIGDNGLNANNNSSSSFSSSSSSFGGNGERRFNTTSSVTRSYMGPDGIMRTETEREEVFDDGSGKNKKHNKIVEKRTHVDPRRVGDIKDIGVIDEVERIESDLTTGESKIIHKKQLPDGKKIEDVQLIHHPVTPDSNNNGNLIERQDDNLNVQSNEKKGWW